MRKNLALWLGILVIVGMGIYPPWKMTFSVSQSDGSMKTVRPFGYAPLWQPPSQPGEKEWAYWGRSIDYNRLGLQWGLVALVTAGLMYTLPRRSEPAGVPKNHPSEEQED